MDCMGNVGRLYCKHFQVNICCVLNRDWTCLYFELRTLLLKELACNIFADIHSNKFIITRNPLTLQGGELGIPGTQLYICLPLWFTTGLVYTCPDMWE